MRPSTLRVHCPFDSAELGVAGAVPYWAGVCPTCGRKFGAIVGRRPASGKAAVEGTGGKVVSLPGRTGPDFPSSEGEPLAVLFEVKGETWSWVGATGPRSTVAWVGGGTVPSRVAQQRAAGVGALAGIAAYIGALAIKMPPLVQIVAALAAFFGAAIAFGRRGVAAVVDPEHQRLFTSLQPVLSAISEHQQALRVVKRDAAEVEERLSALHALEIRWKEQGGAPSVERVAVLRRAKASLAPIRRANDELVRFHTEAQERLLLDVQAAWLANRLPDDVASRLMGSRDALLRARERHQHLLDQLEAEAELDEMLKGAQSAS